VLEQAARGDATVEARVDGFEAGRAEAAGCGAKLEALEAAAVDPPSSPRCASASPPRARPRRARRRAALAPRGARAGRRQSGARAEVAALREGVGATAELRAALAATKAEVAGLHEAVAAGANTGARIEAAEAAAAELRQRLQDLDSREDVAALRARVDAIGDVADLRARVDAVQGDNPALDGLRRTVADLARHGQELAARLGGVEAGGTAGPETVEAIAGLVRRLEVVEGTTADAGALAARLEAVEGLAPQVAEVAERVAGVEEAAPGLASGSGRWRV
jgi:hypothetical protein